MTTASERTHIGFLGDESGSMSGNKKAMVDSFNEFVGQVRKDTNGKAVRLTLGFFDLGGGKDILRVKVDSPLVDVGELSYDAYNPRGSTPLNDATARMISHMEKVSADKRLLVIFTDGLENASEMSTSDLRKLIAEKESEGWEFIYLGANQDAWAEGQTRGVARTSSYNTSATPDGMKRSMGHVAFLASARVNLDPGEYVMTKDQVHASMGGKIDESDDTTDSSPKSESVSGDAATRAADLISGRS